MTIKITDRNGNSIKVRLNSFGDSNENGDQFIYSGEAVDSYGALIKIEVLQHRNHPTVHENDVEISGYILTSKSLIAEKINRVLLKK